MVGISKRLQSQAFPQEQHNMMIMIIMVVVCTQDTWKSNLFILRVNPLFPERFSFTSFCLFFFLSFLLSLIFIFSSFASLFLFLSLSSFFLCCYVLFHSSMFRSIFGARLISLYTFFFFGTLWHAKLISLAFMFPICTLHCRRCFHYCVKDWR